MLDSAGHKVQAERCDAFLKTVSATTFREWLVTVRFYSALHYVDAFMAGQGRRTWRSHQDRLVKMIDYPETRAIRSQFLRLYELSREARYEGTPFTEDDITRVVDPLFQAVRRTMRSALGLPA